jgi:hypothetical protein
MDRPVVALGLLGVLGRPAMTDNIAEGAEHAGYRLTARHTHLLHLVVLGQLLAVLRQAEVGGCSGAPQSDLQVAGLLLSTMPRGGNWITRLAESFQVFSSLVSSLLWSPSRKRASATIQKECRSYNAERVPEATRQRECRRLPSRKKCSGRCLETRMFGNPCYFCSDRCTRYSCFRRPVYSTSQFVSEPVSGSLPCSV